jgi:hypothetical protein
LSRSPANSLAGVALALLSVALPRPAAATARFEVSGSASAADDETLQVSVALTNVGDELAVPVSIEAELADFRREIRLEAGVDKGKTEQVVLHFPLEVPRPGLHAVTLLLEWPVGPPPAGSTLPPTASQRAFLLLTLGASPPPAVTATARGLRLETRGTLEVGLESADGQAHRVAVRVFPPRGLNVFGPPTEVDVPASGRAVAHVDLLRAGAPRDSSQGILVVASAIDGPLERTTVITSVVGIARDDTLIPRLRPFLWGLAAALLAAAGWVELRHRRPAA